MKKNIYVNGIQHNVPNDYLSYTQILRLSGFPENSNPTMTYSNRDLGSKGIMDKNSAIKVEDGINFNVVFTDKA
jgi:hypothetical protein